MAFEIIFGGSKRFRQIVETVDQYARTDFPVLIMGETGVGKELFARRIHWKSGRASHPFIPVNCGALPSELFESELFGHDRGSFSGAIQTSKGLFRVADGGTIFLDEIGELSNSQQIKLLRSIDTGEIRSVGSQHIDQIDCRFIAATNLDLYNCVQNSSFRLDLLERISVLVITIPPLRERKEDIRPLAFHFLSQFAVDLDESGFVLLENYHWPGNIRQLRNVLARASVLSPNKLNVRILERTMKEEMPVGVESPEKKSLAARTLAEHEKQIIIETLKRFEGSRKKTAKALGIAKSTLHEKLRRWRYETSQASFPINRLMPLE